MNQVIKESPFMPGRPVPIEYFVARAEEVRKLERIVNQTASGRNENVFISGERGIGKSSLAGYIRYIAEKKCNFVGNHCYLGGINSLEEMIRIIFQRLLQEVDKSLFEKLRESFDKYIKGINVFGFGIDFTQDKSELRALVDNFIPVMRKICDIIKDDKKGLIIILDDLNGITSISDFSHFIKSFVDELATSQEKLPILIILVGISERREEMIKHQPSITRIFDIVELTPMNESESNTFFTSMFNKSSITIDPVALSLMVELSGGLPMLMHEVGDAIYWNNSDEHIDKKDAQSGILIAAKNVGMKYLDPHVYRTLRSETYRSILRKIAKLEIGTIFHRKEILGKINKSERGKLDNFIKKMKDLGIIRGTDAFGEYVFANQLYHLYFWLEAYSADKEMKSSSKK